MLDKVNAEEDGVEDQDGPPLDLSHANIAGTFFSSNLDILGLGALPSKPSSSHFSSSGGTRPPSSSSLPPMTHPGHPYSTQPCDLSIVLDGRYNVPARYAGRVLMGMDLGPYLGTHAKPVTREYP